ncbi:MAG: hypothetical protein WBG50_01840 [Desulfomonilaceae bacterium]
MELLKIFFGHLYFSIICVAVGLIIIYVILNGIDAESVMSNHLLAMAITCGLVCFGMAAFFTHRTIKSRAQQPIVYTQRQY